MLKMSHDVARKCNTIECLLVVCVCLFVCVFNCFVMDLLEGVSSFGFIITARELTQLSRV